MLIVDIRLGGRAVQIDLDRLSPRARAMAEAIAAHPARVAGDIWMEADRPIRDTEPDWRHWYTEAEAALPERRPWRGWSALPLGEQDPHERLEVEAAKVPPGWHVLGAHPRRPVASMGVAAAAREATSAQVLEYLRERGRAITPATWRSYVGRGQAPRPVRHTGRTPIWDLGEVDVWLSRSTA